MPAQITLFTPYFAARTPERQQEFDLCLERNLSCQHLHRIFLLVDDGHTPPFKDPRLTVLPLARRPTYADWLRLGREQHVHGISLLANTDIHFDDTLPLVRRCLARQQTFLALSRYELSAGTLVAHPEPEWSQDVWGLHTESTLHPELLRSLEVPLGVPRCDNKVAYLFATRGWAVSNPQPLLRSVHVHETQQRHYDKRADYTVMGAVGYVHPTVDAETPSRVDIDIWALNTAAIGSVSLNRSLDRWAAERAGGATWAATARSTAATTPATRSQTPASPATPLAPAKPPRPPAKRNAADLPVLHEEARPPAPAPVAWHRYASSGRLRFSHGRRFEIYEHDRHCLVLDWLQPDRARTVPAAEVAEAPDAPQLLRLFVPPVLDIHPVEVADRPRSATDLQFWQYPAATEKQARDNHLSIAAGANLQHSTRTVHTYLGLPWATYIDKKALPEEVLSALQARLAGLHEFVQSLGWQLAVHTVCQQIHWRRLAAQFVECRITDLHLSHATTDIDPVREGWPLRVHSWPLIAPNVEDPARREGLVIGKPPGQRRYLASFIGAHMAHYRSDVRVKLAEVAAAAGRGDVLVEMSGLWHFNHVVYKEQVAGKALGSAERQSHDDATRRYNEVLSDSVFSLCPEGAGPNTLRVWESLAVGAIPVILAPGWIPPAPTEGAPGLEDCCLFVDHDELPTLFDRLAAVSLAERQRMQAAALAAYQRLRLRRAFAAGA